MSNNRLFLDVHAIQTLPPSNINRDDTGSPKTCQYGGVKRARVSSQSWKRAMRIYFIDNVDRSYYGLRTNKSIKSIAEKLVGLDTSLEENAENIVLNYLSGLGHGSNNKPKGLTFEFNKNTQEYITESLLFLSNNQIQGLANIIYSDINSKKKNKNISKELSVAINSNLSADIALFGRMVASAPKFNVDASSQVAHAISTHSVDTEFDFFTAVDDLAPEENAGAGMLGTVEFNSSTLYRYANVAIHELYKQLENKEATLNTSKLFVKSFANSLPTGKVNTFANQTLPQFVMVTLRDDRPVNLVSAFENPIRSNGGYVEKSVNALLNENEKVEKFINKAQKTFILDLNNYNFSSDEIENENSLNELIDDLGNFLDTELSNW